LQTAIGNTKSAKEETQKAQISISIFLCAFCVGFALFVFSDVEKIQRSLPEGEIDDVCYPA